MEFRKDNPILLNSIVILLLLSLCVQGLAQNCSSLPCLNGGTCQDSQDGFICDCPTQPLTFIGPTCAKLHEACEAIGCSKNYTCHSVSGHSEYQCTCTVGSNCSSNMCEPNPCALPNFQCIESEDAFICRCQAGYFGANCEKVMNGCTQNPCQNNGSCSAQTGSYTCACKPGYTGQHCEVDINECSSNPCQNDAICVDKVNKYLCFCVPGFQGYHCEIDINECASRPCFNNGTCINQMDQYECDCATGYTGVNCETEINECESDPCQNGATCKDHIGYFSCDCPAGYEGELCQQDIDECQSQPCQNGGICVDDVNRFNCNCSETGFAGDMCEIDIPECASNPCLNNATCIERVKRYDCHCWPGYSGDHCYVDINECLDGPCENGALCLERSNQSFYGKEPEFSYDFRYSQAAGYVCRCRAGFTGENCSVDIDECESEPCQNDGSCADLINGFMCNCAPGFTGLVCSIDIDDCESNPCENGATCTDAVDDYYCGCLTPALDGITWGGKNCSIQLEGCRIHSCQNQAACIPKYEENIHSYICKCQPGFYGENCTIQTTFSFTSNGYILYDLHSTNRSKRHTDSVTGQAGQFSVRFRTTLPNMILMYRGNEDNYLILELYNGLLNLQFWRNSTHLVLSHHRLDDGYWHKVKVLTDTSVQLILHHEDCANGICSTEEIIKNAQLPESFNTVYIGGLAEEALLNNTISRQNFTGCMEDLEIDSMIQLPQNFNKLFEMELGCNKTDWCHPNPCHYGALCIDLWASMRCECIRPYRGPTCMQEYTPGTFSKEGVPSYASFTVAQGIGNNFNISAFIRTLKPDGLLLAVSNVTEDYFQLFLRNGWLHVSIVSATPLIFKEYLSDGKTYFINISMKEGLVTINHLDVETRLGHLPNVSIESRDEIFIGGLPENDHLRQQGGYFKGCLQDIRLNNHRLEFFKLVTEDIKMEEILYPEVINNVTMNCESDPTCDSGPCKNGGDCTVTWNDFTCSCPTNFTGRTCEEPVWCESKPCPSNTTCQDVPGGYVCVADVTFLGDHPVVFASNVSTDQQLTSVSLAFRTRDRNAVLLNASKDMDSIFIAIHNGYLQVTLQSGNSVEHVQYAGRIDVSDAVWHKIVISMKDPSHRLSQWTIQLDNDVAETPQGTAGSLMFLTKDTMVVLAENYTGCLGQLCVQSWMGREIL
uniref:Crumbs cell polarity complex component 2 n=1 Tax=Leptobrachium leishanense TaxID=445787 RepID=A0A8C5WE73_9ANUR